MDGVGKVMLQLIPTKRTEPHLLQRMRCHYSRPGGFVGRSICYAILYDGVYYGHIVAGSATRFLPGRNNYLGISIGDLNRVINNVFFNVARVNGKYPVRNFTSFIIKKFVETSSVDWASKYGDDVVGFETLIEKPRTGELYARAGWKKVGETIGYTCKRIAGNGTDSWSGKRVWDTKNLKPKNVFCYKVLELSNEE